MYYLCLLKRTFAKINISHTCLQNSSLASVSMLVRVYLWKCLKNFCTSFKVSRKLFGQWIWLRNYLFISGRAYTEWYMCVMPHGNWRNYASIYVGTIIMDYILLVYNLEASTLCISAAKLHRSLEYINMWSTKFVPLFRKTTDYDIWHSCADFFYFKHYTAMFLAVWLLKSMILGVYSLWQYNLNNVRQQFKLLWSDFEHVATAS